MPKPKPTVASLTKAADALPGDLDTFAAEHGLGEDDLALHIDQKLDGDVWLGTRFADRAEHLTNRIAQDVLTQMDQSLMAQESYDEFEARMMKNLGIDAAQVKAEGMGWLGKADRQLAQETRLAWNTALVSANRDADTVLVWRAVLDDVTTPTCWENHGQLIDDIGMSPPEHFGCRCDIFSCPSPESEDEEWAALGQEILDEMAAERDSGSAETTREVEVPCKLSRFATLREGYVSTWAEKPQPTERRPSRLWKRIAQHFPEQETTQFSETERQPSGAESRLWQRIRERLGEEY